MHTTSMNNKQYHMIPFGAVKQNLSAMHTLSIHIFCTCGYFYHKVKLTHKLHMQHLLYGILHIQET